MPYITAYGFQNLGKPGGRSRALCSGCYSNSIFYTVLMKFFPAYQDTSQHIKILKTVCSSIRPCAPEMGKMMLETC